MATAFRYAVPLILLITALPILNIARLDYLSGGQRYRQADWLITLDGGHLRRGFMGESYLWLSDLLSLDLLAMLISIQLLLFAGIVCGLVSLWRKLKDNLLILFLIATPGFMLFFWGGDVGGAFRKELFGLLALVLMACAAQSLETRTIIDCGRVLHALLRYDWP